MKKYILNIVRRICGTQKLSDEIKQLKECMRAMNYNILQLALDSETIYINDGDNVCPLYRDEHGKLSFTPPVLRKSDPSLPSIIVVTLPKSGTHLWMKILEECGFVLTGVESIPANIVDLRGLPADKYYQSKHSIINMPFYLQAQCLRRGEVLPGHMDFSCSEYIQGRPFLITKRDLRTCTVSMLRHCQRYKSYSGEPWHSLGLTEDALCSFIQSAFFEVELNLCREIIKWDQAFPDHVVRYEDVQQPGSAEYAGVVEKLSRITGLDANSVSAAIERARGTRTFTYSGKKSSLDGIWSDRVEARFQELQGHILNEQLGYSRDWRPA